MNPLLIRTEDLRLNDILDLFVETSRDRQIVDSLKSPSPVVLEGSRGTGKSFLLRVAEAELLNQIETQRVLPVYLSFVRSSLIHTNDDQQFHHWMLAKLCARIIRTLHKTGQLAHSPASLSILAAGPVSFADAHTKIDAIAKSYEDSYKHPRQEVGMDGIPSVDTLKEALEDICEDLKINRIAIFFDEAAHIFRPEQQRQFFTLFRDLRAPHISCNAAVYPGVTAYGPTFQIAHDAAMLEINRNVHDDDYRESMWEIVAKQADADLQAKIERNRENFFALAYAVSGNPRLLLKTVNRALRMNAKEVTSVLKDFYRTEIWSEHSGLAETYVGHRVLVDWGRKFIEESVIPNTRSKNEQWATEGRNEATCYFWIHRDAPEAVKEALRLLSYTGIVVKGDSGIAATRSEIGTRYALNLGCLAAGEAMPIPTVTRIASQLTQKRFTEYGANAAPFADIADAVGQFEEPDMSSILERQLSNSVSVLDITEFQQESLKTLGLDTIGKALDETEEDFQKADYIGPKRSRRMMNAVVASVLEYLSG